MTEGTKSYLIGYHHFLLHPLWVLIAWKLEYKSWPKWWEIVCIFLHDAGVCGRQYLSDEQAKKGHWELGANLAYRIILKHSKTKAISAYLLCAGHCPGESGFDESRLFRADKRSPLVSPTCWLWWNYLIEGFKTTKPREWKKAVAENMKRKKPMGNHQLYLSILNERARNI